MCSSVLRSSSSSHTSFTAAAGSGSVQTSLAVPEGLAGSWIGAQKLAVKVGATVCYLLTGGIAVPAASSSARPTMRTNSFLPFLRHGCPSDCCDPARGPSCWSLAQHLSNGSERVVERKPVQTFMRAHFLLLECGWSHVHGQRCYIAEMPSP